jgi:hypothetical protein
MNGRTEMKCEEFELFGLESRRDHSLNDDCRQRAAQHARACAKCSALSASWQAAQTELVALGESTQGLEAPSRIEIRVLQQFRLKHQARQERRTLKVATWMLAAAAALVCTVSVWDWHKWRQGSSGNVTTSDTATADGNTGQGSATSDSARLASNESSDLLIAGNEGGDFTQLPGALSQELEDGAIVRVGMQRASLAAFGLPVNEERAGDWIQVDLLVAGDGSAQAVRLPE